MLVRDDVNGDDDDDDDDGNDGAGDFVVCVRKAIVAMEGLAATGVVAAVSLARTVSSPNPIRCDLITAAAIASSGAGVVDVVAF